MYDRRDAGDGCENAGVENWLLLSSMTVGGDNNKKIKVKNDNSKNQMADGILLFVECKKRLGETERLDRLSPFN